MRVRDLLSFRQDARGTVAMIFGVGTPVLFGIVGVAVDYSTFVRQKTILQKAADAAAIAATRELQLGKMDEQRLQSVAQATVDSLVTPARGDGPISVKASPVGGQDSAGKSGDGVMSRPSSSPATYRGVKVVLTQRKDAVMSRLVTPQLTDMQITATAQLAGGAKVCVVGLEEVAADAIRMDDSARISAGDCSVYTNSKSPTAIRVEGNAAITSALTCSSGGYKSSSSANFKPRSPVPDCPKTADPLIDRPAPPVGSCGVLTKVVKGVAQILKLGAGSHTLQPGTYCGGLHISKGATVTLNPGVYVIKDGPLIIGPAKKGEDEEEEEEEEEDEDDGTVASRGSVKGTGVGFFFTGTIKSKKGKALAMRFEPNSVVEITAPTSGPMAGILFHEDRASAPDRRYEILSDGARKLVGTIYLPRGVFEVSANQAVADLSEYTAVVAKRIELFKAPNLVLNTRYGDTTVPVPTGLGVVAGSARLTE